MFFIDRRTKAYALSKIASMNKTLDTKYSRLVYGETYDVVGQTSR